MKENESLQFASSSMSVCNRNCFAYYCRRFFKTLRDLFRNEIDRKFKFQATLSLNNGKLSVLMFAHESTRRLDINIKSCRYLACLKLG